MAIEIIGQNSNFLVVNKPTGFSTHHSPGDNAPNVIDTLAENYLQLFPVMRLDNGTSGLLVVGLTPEFVRETVFYKKIYQAIVLGETPERGEIDKPLTKRKFGTAQKIKQEALSSYRQVAKSSGYSLLEIEIATGRHHQIRKHLRSIGHPVLGDFRHGYNDKNLQVQEQLQDRLRLCLHCGKLEFSFRGKSYKYELVLPPDMVEIWQMVGNAEKQL